jgi:hypothetical protein
VAGAVCADAIVRWGPKNKPDSKDKRAREKRRNRGRMAPFAGQVFAAHR